MAIYVALAALAVAILTMLINLWNIVRGQQWRNTDDGKAVNIKIALLTERTTVIETTLKSIPTSAQVATLTEVSKSNHELLLITRAQLTRLEGFFYGEKDR